MSISHILLIAIVALVLFGPNKLPELGRAIGRTMREFKKGTQGLMDDLHEATSQEERKDVTPRPYPDPVSDMQLPPVKPPAEQQSQPVQPAQQVQQVQQAQPAQPPVQPAQPGQIHPAPEAKPAGQNRQDRPVDTRRLPD